MLRKVQKPPAIPVAQPERNSFREMLRLAYHGDSLGAIRFRLALLVIDLAIIAFFVASPIIREAHSFIWIDYALAALLSADIVARVLASTHILRFLRQPIVWLDIVILLTLLFPETLANFGFLRIIRLWSLSRSGALWKPLRRLGLSAWRETANAVVSLITFLFVTAGLVYTFFFRARDGVSGYVDALYFTVATITTTGFGDITLPGTAGKLTSIAIMIVGLTLFVRLAQAVFRPTKVFFSCPACALQRHDPDAVHCKACGHILQIPDEGE